MYDTTIAVRAENSGNWEQAAELWTSLLADVSGDEERAVILTQIVRCHLEDSERERAEARIHELRSLSERSNEAVIKAMVDLSEGRIRRYKNENNDAVASFTRAMAGFSQRSTMRTETTLLLAEAHREDGRLDAALEALDLLRDEDLTTQHAAELADERGAILIAQGEYDNAVATLTEALKLDRDTGNEFTAGRSRLLLAEALLGAGKRDEAHDHITRAMADYRSAGDDGGLSDSYGVLGQYHEEEDRLGSALSSYKDGLALDVKTRDDAGQVAALRRIGSIHRRNGDFDDAEENLDQAEQHVGTDNVERANVLVERSLLRIEQGKPQEASDLLARALRHVQDDHDARRVAIIKRTLARAMREAGQTSESERLLGEARAYFTDRNDRRELSTTFDELAELYLEQGRHEEAQDLARASRDIDLSLNMRTSEARSLVTLGRSYLRQGAYDDAFRHLEEALRIHESLETQSGSGQSEVLHWLGVGFAAKGSYEEAKERLLEGWWIDTRQGDRLGAIRADRALASVLRQTGSLDAAAQRLDQIQRDVDALRTDRIEKSLVDLEWAELHVARGELDRVRPLLDSAERQFRASGNRVEHAWCRRLAGVVEARTGDTERAIVMLRQAEAVFREVGERPAEDTVLDDLAEVFVMQGDFLEAERAITSSEAIGRKIRYDSGNGRSMLIRARIALFEGDLTRSLDQAEQGLQDFKRSRDTRGQVEAQTLMAECHLRQGRTDVAHIDSALAMIRQARSQAQSTGNALALARLFTLSAVCYLFVKDGPRADVALETANDWLGSIDDEDEIARQHFVRGLIYADQNKHRQALDEYERASRRIESGVDRFLKDELAQVRIISLVQSGELARVPAVLVAVDDAARQMWAVQVKRLHPLVRQASLRLMENASYDEAVSACFVRVEQEIRSQVPPMLGEPYATRDALTGLLNRVTQVPVAKSSGLDDRADLARDFRSWGSFVQGAFQLFRNEGAHRTLALGGSDAFSRLAVADLILGRLDGFVGRSEELPAAGVDRDLPTVTESVDAVRVAVETSREDA